MGEGFDNNRLWMQSRRAIVIKKLFIFIVILGFLVFVGTNQWCLTRLGISQGSHTRSIHHAWMKVHQTLNMLKHKFKKASPQIARSSLKVLQKIKTPEHQWKNKMEQTRSRFLKTWNKIKWNIHRLIHEFRLGITQRIKNFENSFRALIK